MKGSMDIVKGRIKESAGALLNNDRLRAEGQIDQAVGHVKRIGEKSVHQARKSARKIMDNAKHIEEKALR